MQKWAAEDTGTWGSAINLEDVSKTFIQRHRGQKKRRFGLAPMVEKKICALDHVSLRIEKGEFVAYAGPNGAGKSTTFKLLCGLLAPDSGQVRSLSLNPMQGRIALMRRCGVLFGNRSELWWDHPVRTSFEWKRTVWDIPKAKYDRMFSMVVDLLDLEPFLDTFVRELSLGQRMRADLGLLLLHEPELVLLDEPTLGLDVLAKRQMIDFLKKINREEGSTILVTSHDMDDLTEMAQRIVMIHQGRIAFDGSCESLQAISGAKRTLTITSPGTAPDLPGAEFVASEDSCHTYTYDAQKTQMSALFESLSQIEGLCNVETGELPIETVIAELYLHWQGKK